MPRDAILSLRVSWPSGKENVVERRGAVLDLRCGRGWSPLILADVVNVVYGALALPLGCNEKYIGNGNLELRLRPSAWTNPFTWICDTMDEATTMFRAYAAVRMDKCEWLSPLCGNIVRVEDGIDGAHAIVVCELIKSMVGDMGESCGGMEGQEGVKGPGERIRRGGVRGKDRRYRTTTLDCGRG